MPTRILDSLDRRILEQLQRAGRMTNLELAERVAISASPCLRRVRLLESEQVINGYAAQLNREKIGLGLMVFVSVKLKNHNEELEAGTFRRAVIGMPEVVGCHVTSGQHDFVLQVVAPDLAGYRRFMMDSLLKLPEVSEIQSSFVIDTIKEDTPLPLTHLR